MDQHPRHPTHNAYEFSHVPPSQLQLHPQHARQPSNPSISVQQQQQQQDPALTQSRMEESLKRSATLVFWYKAGCDPLRLHQEIATFPLFSLSQFTQLVNDLGLSPNTFVDSYNPHSSTWEQQTITTVRLIESEQRLLFRIRKSLLDGLSDNDCPGTDHEIGLQSRFTRSPSAPVVLPVNSLKRPADPSDSYGPPTKYYRHDDYSAQRTYAASPPAQENNVYPQSISVAKSQPPNDIPVPTYPHHSPPTQNSHPPANIQPSHTHAPPNNSHQYPTPSPGLSTPSTSQSSSSEPAIPYHPHPPLKRWPNDYTVSEIAAGFRQMDAMISAQPTLTQKSTFQKVFGCRYIKSTVCRHRAVWKRADPGLKDTYEKMGTDERAVWGEFVKKAEGKIPPAPNTGGGGSMNGNGHRSQANVDTSQTNGHTTGHSHLAPQPGQMMSSMQAPVPPPTSVTMGMLTHGMPPHVGLGPDPDKNEGPPVMASLVPPPSHVNGGSMHSVHVLSK